MPLLESAFKSLHFHNMTTPIETLEEIARLITQGNTSGILDDEEGNRTSWTLNVVTFENN